MKLQKTDLLNEIYKSHIKNRAKSQKIKLYISDLIPYENFFDIEKLKEILYEIEKDTDKEISMLDYSSISNNKDLSKPIYVQGNDGLVDPVAYNKKLKDYFKSKEARFELQYTPKSISNANSKNVFYLSKEEGLFREIDGKKETMYITKLRYPILEALNTRIQFTQDLLEKINYPKDKFTSTEKGNFSKNIEYIRDQVAKNFKGVGPIDFIVPGKSGGYKYGDSYRVIKL